MLGQWNRLHLQLGEFFWAFFVLFLQGDRCQSLNLEGLALVQFRLGVDVDPYGSLKNWNPREEDPCNWSGVHCVDGRVTMLDLRGMHLEGTLSPEIGKLNHLRALILFENKFYGEIPMEIGGLSELEILDLRGNNLIATKTPKFDRRVILQELSNLEAAAPRTYPSREIVTVSSTGSGSFPAFVRMKGSNDGIEDGELEYNGTPGMSSNSDQIGAIGGGSSENQSKRSQRSWAYVLVLPGAAFFFTLLAAMLVMLRSPENSSISPWRTGLSGPLQKAFVTGVPKLNRPELEAACEDFSNIIQSFPDFTVFKGTLSSGVEIAVVSTSISSLKDWSKSSQVLFQKKIDGLSRVNHKNFVNLLGYCEENEPFTRMMVFEYAPNGTLHEHLHVKELEHLDWGMRMRIVMGVAYCLQHMHHDLSPPIVLPSFRSGSVFLTDDYAAKIAEIGFWKDVADRGRISLDDDLSFSDSLSIHPENNVYDFGLLLLEIISAKHPYNDQLNSIRSWVAEFISDWQINGSMIDPTLKSVKNKELDVICEVIQGCVNPDSKRRMTMREVAARLQEVTGISPESATPRLSPLWWAELEILTEAS